MDDFTILLSAQLADEPMFTESMISGVSFIRNENPVNTSPDMFIADEIVDYTTLLDFSRQFPQIPIILIVSEHIKIEAIRQFSTFPLIHFLFRPLEREQVNHIILHYQGLRNTTKQNVLALEAANAETAALAYSISHDLMAPVRAINGYSRILSEEIGDTDNEHVAQMLSRLQANSTKLGDMITSILEFSRIGTRQLHLEQLNMKNMARHALNLNMTSKSQITADIGDLTPVVGDSELLQQVWIYLISNAVKFSENISGPIIAIGSRPTESSVIYYVSDNGSGFNMQYADRLFKAFQRLHSPSEFSGLGMGLAMVDKIVKRHSGKAWIESDINVGTTVFFELPCNNS